MNINFKTANNFKEVIEASKKENFKTNREAIRWIKSRAKVWVVDIELTEEKKLELIKHD